MTNKVTIKDVAEAAGVSTQTVSRVINSRPDVSPSTRARVQKVINELGYSPNVIARSLSRGRTNTFGVVGFGLGYFGPTQVLLGIEQKSNELGFSLLFSLLEDFDADQIDDILNNLLSRQVDGIIWAVPGNDRLVGELSGRLNQISKPVVYLNKPQNRNEVIVAMDNYMGGRIATEHLLANGYRQIGIITGPIDWWEAQEREKGWRKSMLDAGISNLDDFVVQGDWTASSGEIGLQTLLSKSSSIEAVFAGNDQMALGALKEARKIGLNVPKDLGIVGFDDIPEAAFFYPSLTTIRQSAIELGSLAVDQLCKLIDCQENEVARDTEVKWIRPSLVIRQSSTPK